MIAGRRVTAGGFAASRNLAPPSGATDSARFEVTSHHANYAHGVLRPPAMCGIVFSCTPSSTHLELAERLKQPLPTTAVHLSCIVRRGPDGLQGHIHQTPNHHVLYFLGSLLSVRGGTPLPQPLVCPTTQSVLCWNGNLWRVSGSPLELDENDTQAVFRQLLDAPEGAVDRVLGAIEGEYAFVFYDAVRDTVWYGRDWLGRRSLLRKIDDGALVISSVGVEEETGWEEVEAGGLWRVNVKGGNSKFLTTIQDGPCKGKPVRESAALLLGAVAEEGTDMEAPSSERCYTFRSAPANARISGSVATSCSAG